MKLSLVVSNFSSGLHTHPLVRLGVKLVEKGIDVDVYAANPFIKPTKVEIADLRNKGLKIRAYEINNKVSISWIQLQFTLFEALVANKYDLVISESFLGPTALYANFNYASCPVITYITANQYEEKIKNEQNFHHINEIISVILEETQILKSDYSIWSNSRTYELFETLNPDLPKESRIPAIANGFSLEHIEEIDSKVLENWLALIKNTKLKSETDVGRLPENKISVIISTKNRGQFLPAALESCVNQNLKPCEIIVIDDGSDDESEVLNIVAQFDGKLKINYRRNELSVGQAKSRNIGAREAIGDILCFLDDDNILLENHFEELAMVLSDSEISAACTFMNLVYKDSPILKTDEVDSIAIFCGDHFQSLNRIYNFVCDTHIAIRKQTFLDLGGFPEFLKSSQEDWGLGLEIIERGYKFKSTGKPTILYRVNNNGVWANGNGVRKWWPLHQVSNQGISSPWWMDEIARFGLTHTVQNQNRLYKRYLDYALYLIRQKDFKTLMNGFLRLIRQRFK